MLVVNNLRGLKGSYSCSIICVGSPSSGPIFWGAEISAVKGYVPYCPIAATLTFQTSPAQRKKILTTNGSLVTIMTTRGSSPSYTMCYFNLQWSEQWVLHPHRRNKLCAYALVPRCMWKTHSPKQLPWPSTMPLPIHSDFWTTYVTHHFRTSSVSPTYVVTMGDINIRINIIDNAW